MKPYSFSTSVSISIALTQLIGSTSFADRKWNDANDPKNLDSSYNFNFNQLPPKGDVTNTQRGWSDSYWPKTRGYIAERWQDPRYAGIDQYKKYPMVSGYALRSMSEDQIYLLSPAEKFDIVRGKFDFPLATELRKKDAKPSEWWKGLCNGWTQASININEPHPITFTAPRSQIKVKLNSSDIKGLMAYYYSYRDRAGAQYIGKSCRAGKKLLLGLDGSCTDVHAAAFHIALSNEIGIKKNALAIDRDPTVQVWNQPFVKYESVVDRVEDRNISKKATEGTRREVFVTTTVHFANELYKIDPSEIQEGQTAEDLENDRHVDPQAQPILGTELQKYGSKVYKYVLELNSRDQIIGGDWLDDSDPTPDLIWKQNFSMPGIGYDDKDKADDWSILKDIIQQATTF